MPIHKLQPGREHAIIGTVIDAELAKSKNPQYKSQYRLTLATTQGEELTLYESQAGVDRQLARLGIRLVDLIGQPWRFSKTPKQDDPSRGFINIDRVSAAQAASAPPRPAPAPSAGPAIPGLDDDWELIDDSATFPQQLAQGGYDAPASPPQTPAPAPAPLLSKDEQAQRHYRAHFGFYMGEIFPAIIAAARDMEVPVEVNVGDINSAIATLMIESSKR